MDASTLFISTQLPPEVKLKHISYIELALPLVAIPQVSVIELEVTAVAVRSIGIPRFSTENVYVNIIFYSFCRMYCVFHLVS